MPPARRTSEFSAKVVYNLAIQGDQAARDIFHRVGWALGILVADLVNLLNLNIYVIGGGVVGGVERFQPGAVRGSEKALDGVRRHRARRTRYAAGGASGEVVSPSTGQPTIITRALLGSDAGLFGAARLPMVEGERSGRRGRGQAKIRLIYDRCGAQPA